MGSLTEYNSYLSNLVLNTPEDQQIPLFRQLCRTDLFFLLRHGMGRKDVEREWLFQRCLEVQDDPDGHLDLWSRDHYKSTIITVGKSLQDILATHGDDPIGDREITIGIFSHTRPIAKGFLRQIKRELEANEKLKEWFPDILFTNPHKESPKWSEDDGIIVKRKSNPKECTVEAWGVVDGQPISKHFELLVYDDIVTRDSVNTTDMIAKTTEMLELSFALGTQGGRRRFIGTRYHFNDSYKVMMDRGTVSERVYPATKNGKPDGEPVLLNKEQLEEKRRDMGEYTFACQMLQNPVADASQGFKREWIKHYDKVNHRVMNKYILVDAANSKKDSADYTAMWVIGLGPDENYYVLEFFRDRMNLTERTRRLMDLHKKWKPHRFGVRYEKYGMMLDIEHIESVQAQETYRFDIIKVAGAQKKEDRIRRLIPLFEQHKVYFPRQQYYTMSDGKTYDMVKVFIEQEYMAFPVSVHDDLLDALSRIAEPEDIQNNIKLYWPKGHMGGHDDDGPGGGQVNTKMQIFGKKIW